VAGVPGDWLIPSVAAEDPSILFFHGGGMIFGWGSPNRCILGYLAKFAGLRGYGVDYRLAPEHCFPAANDDCFAVYRALILQGKQIVLVGESSGGVLALSTMLRAKASGLRQPLACLLISPMVDFAFTGENDWEDHDAFVHPRFLARMITYYAHGADMTQPGLSPISADLRGLAPLYVLAGERDILRHEAERLVRVAQEQGVDVEFCLWPEAWHAWHVLPSQLPEARDALRLLGEVIRHRLG
jgi:acetyl esterase/lipase